MKVLFICSGLDPVSITDRRPSAADNNDAGPERVLMKIYDAGKMVPL